MLSRQVLVRWVALDGIDPADWPRLASMLDDCERDRASRFRFERDYHSYVAAHALGRSLLSQWVGGPPQGWRFSTGEHGKPEVIVPTGSPRLRLNLSHTQGMAAAVLAEDMDVGVDVEWLGRRNDVTAIASRYFAPSECACLAAVPPGQEMETFLAFWTLKEAYVKAIGKGLAQPLDSFAFTLDPLSIRFDDSDAGPADHWLFRRLSPTAKHRLALAVHKGKQSGITMDCQAFSL